jgi:thioredoxin-like negative regulator of GroEL
MSPIPNLTESTAEKVLDESDLIFLLFRRPACPACAAFGKIFEEAAERHPELVFAQIDTVAEAGLARAFEVESVPTLGVIRQQVLLLLQPGVLKAEALEEVVQNATALDMDRVREDIAAESREESR